MATYKQISYLKSLLEKNNELSVIAYKFQGREFNQNKMSENRKDILRLAEEGDSKSCSAAISQFIDINSRLTHILKSAGHDPDALKKAGAAPAELEPGTYFETIANGDGTDYIQIWKAQRSKTSGHVYVKKLFRNGAWKYAAGMTKHVLNSCETLSFEKAVEYGKMYGQCGSCGKTLTNPDSIAAGIGPICADKF